MFALGAQGRLRLGLILKLLLSLFLESWRLVGAAVARYERLRDGSSRRLRAYGNVSEKYGRDRASRSMCADALDRASEWWDLFRLPDSNYFRSHMVIDVRWLPIWSLLLMRWGTRGRAPPPPPPPPPPSREGQSRDRCDHRVVDPALRFSLCKRSGADRSRYDTPWGCSCGIVAPCCEGAGAASGGLADISRERCLAAVQSTG